ncbi:MAG: tyrosine-type recombinase/integrase [Synechococcaceae cyanobacterium SM2_3_1]|nr:tyrosine-type recombinase/integrase [Synechococcaceae cyanobacterium SM2_3_1]
MRLRWRYEGQRYTLSIGLPDSRVNRQVAQRKATQIELDMASSNFDPTLHKYKPKTAKVQAEEPQLLPLLEQRIQTQFNQADAALLNLFRRWGRKVKSPDDAERFIQWLKDERQVSNSTIQRYLNTLKKLDRANFGHLSIKVEKKGIPSAYTAEQVNAILAFLKESHYYNFYYDFVNFYLLTGCRTSEAIALRWPHVDFHQRVIRFEESLAEQGDGSLKVKAPKTGEPRLFPMNHELMLMLKERSEKMYAKLSHNGGNDLVFPAKEGGYIDRRDFVRRCWRACLKAAGIEYIPRKTTQYKTCHTVISHGIEKGVNPVAIADLVGHDVRTLYDKYASVINRVELPSLYD